MTGVLCVLLVLVIGAPVGLAALWRAEVEPQQSNVLIVLIDTLRADHLGSYGYFRDTSPNIDKVAREGWRFTQCNCSGTMDEAFGGVDDYRSLCKTDLDQQWRLGNAGSTGCSSSPDFGCRASDVG